MNDKKTLICVPVCERRASALPEAIMRAAQFADVIELRLDYMLAADIAVALNHLDSLTSANRASFIFTFRPSEQGGRQALSLSERIGFWNNLWRGLRESHGRAPAFADIELDLLECEDAAELKTEIPEETRVICSYHDFKGDAANLEAIYERMKKTRAGVFKIAVSARDITDCIPVLQLLERARSERLEMIAVAMGEAGILTRILGPSRGSFLTYASMDAAHQTAPGQISARELRDLYRVREINEQTQIMGLMGSPVAHSFSPQMHNRAFQACGLDAVYIPFEVRNARAFLSRMVHPRTRELDWNLRGLSVTAPHKISIMEQLDWVELSAKEIGAVNTIFVQDEMLCGYNTDASGFLAPLREKVESLSNLRVALIGAGGAARSALWALQREGANLTLFARDVEKAQPLAEQFDARCEKLEGASFAGFDVVVNATPLGTRGQVEDETPAVASQLRGARIAYDLVYNPPVTRFMREAQHAGCETIGGLNMLVAQAAEQFKLWTSINAPVEIMREAIKEVMSDE
ncbi:MAG: shikimate dehydrogenase [Pyrinomonadaceae bacterium]